MCEVGGHKQGLYTAGIKASYMKIFQGPTAPEVSIESNYLTAWGFDADTTQFSIKLTDFVKTYTLSSDICEPQLVVHQFKNEAGFILVQGNLHIRILAGRTVGMPMRQKMV